MSEGKRGKVAKTSPDIAAERTEALRELFPEAVSESKVDFDKLRAALGDEVDGGPERYSFSWAGKRDAIRLLQVPSRATLVAAPEESVNFGATGHVFIEGENLEVLKLLYKAYAGRVKMIYIDPPYNTGNDFIYPDNFADPLDTYLKLTGQKDGDGNLLTSNPETSGRFHSAWLSMMYPRLFMARQMLKEDGILLISIDDTEQANLRLILNEIFGEENFLATIVWKGATDNNPTRIAREHEYILCYARQVTAVPAVWDHKSHPARLAMLEEYKRLKSKYGSDIEAIQRKFRQFIKNNKETLIPLIHYNRIDSHGPFTGSRKVHNPKPGGYQYDVIHPKTGKPCVRPANGYRYPEEHMKNLVAEGRIIFGDDERQILQIKEYLEDYTGKLSSVIHFDSRTGANELEHLFGERKLFPNPKPAKFLKELFEFCIDEDSIIMDFFAGSCSAAHSILQMNFQNGGNRRFIMVQLPELAPEGSIARKLGYATISDIGKERIRRVIAKMKEADAGKLALQTRDEPEDLGFAVFKLAESHYRQWAGVEGNDPERYAKEMEMFTDPLLPGWKPENVLWEVALKEGYSLTARIEQVAGITGNHVYLVTDPDKGQSFRICLDAKLKPEMVKALGLTKDDLFICRDVALTDELAANLALQCRLKTI
jgi:adenine-specific DNA-methyltransferase